MKLQHIELNQLKTTTINVRKIGAKDIADLLPSIRSLGLLQPLLVRPNCQGYEIIAGQRRYHALLKLTEEGIDQSVPCIIMDKGDDAKAIEASLTENIARLPMDEIDQFKAFAALTREGQTTEEIAYKFGISEQMVKQRLAIANLHKPILTAFRKDQLNAATMRILTFGTKSQQQKWYKLFRQEDAYAPLGSALKAWLFGGSEITVACALFPIEDYKGAIKSDLFGEDQYFVNTDQFWKLQNQAIAAKAEEYKTDGWSDVIILDVGQRFSYFNMDKRSKQQSGKLYIGCASNGEVEIYEGWLETKEVKRLEKEQAKADGSYQPPSKHELTKAAQIYMSLHRHAATRIELLKSPDIALRLMVAHAIAGSTLWKTIPETHCTGGQEKITHSLEASKAEKDFAKQRKAMLKLLDIKDDRDYLISTSWKRDDLVELFDKLFALNDKQIMRILSFTMAETLSAKNEITDHLYGLLNVDMSNFWQADDVFFDLLRNKSVINSILSEVAGKAVASAHITSTAIVQKSLIQNYLSGKNQSKVEGWMPRYMQAPISGYTEHFS